MIVTDRRQHHLQNHHLLDSLLPNIHQQSHHPCKHPQSNPLGAVHLVRQSLRLKTVHVAVRISTPALATNTESVAVGLATAELVEIHGAMRIAVMDANPSLVYAMAHLPG